MRMFYFISFFLFSLLSCQQDDELLPVLGTDGLDSTNQKLEVIWQEPLSPVDTGYYSSFPPVIYNHNVLFSLRFLKDWDILYMRDGNSGDLLWEWDNPIGTGYSLSRHGQYTYDGKLLYGVQSHNYCIDLTSGNTIWEDDDPQSGGPRIRLIGNYYYRESNPSGTPDYYSTLLRSNVDLAVPKWDTVFTIYQSENNGYCPTIEMPSLWLHPSNDSIIVFQNRQFNFQTSDGKVDLYAYNLSQAKLLWKLEDISPISGNSSVQPPLIHQDKIYFQGDQMIQCYEALTGKLIWENTDAQGNFEHFILSNMILEEGILVVKNDNDFIHGFDPDTGVELWRQTQAGSDPTSMVYYNGNVYYTGGGRLFAVAVKTGEIIWNFKSPNKSSDYPEAIFVGTGVNIDPMRRHLYTADGYFAMCIGLPE